MRPSWPLRRLIACGRSALIASVGLGREFRPGFLDGFATARRRRQIKPVLDALFADPALVTRRLVNEVLQYKRLDGVEDALAAIARNLVADGEQTVCIREHLATYAGRGPGDLGRGRPDRPRLARRRSPRTGCTWR